MTNIEFLRTAPKVYFVAMKAELDAENTSSPVVYTGVGKARAARALVRYYIDNKALFDGPQAPVIVSIGTAGSAKFRRGEIVMVDRFFNNGDSFIREEIATGVYPQPTGLVCASSDFFVGPENFSAGEVAAMHEQFDCMDMESFALASLCRELGLRFCAVKCISDGADDTVLNFDEELPKFREKLNAFVRSLE